MEIEGNLLLVQLCLVSATTQEPNKNPIAFLERLKEALQKFTNLYLDSYEGQVILKDKFLSQCASDIRIKLQQLQQQDPAAPLDEMVQTATNTFYNRTGEGGQGPGKGEKERRHAQMLAALQGSPMANPEFLKDKAPGKCLICRQDIGPKRVQTVASLLKWFAINAINWDIGWCSALGTQESQGQVPSFSSRRFNRIETAPPASPPVTDNHHVALNVAGRSENFLVDTGATCSVLASYSGAFSSQTCGILGATGKTITKRFT